MFIDREDELAALNRRWQSNQAELFVLYGRRRVGKTELLKQFCQGKRSLYFLASQVKEIDNLRGFTEAARQVIDDPALEALTFLTWQAALIYIGQQAVQERLVIVLDEFQYLCEDNSALPSIIQQFWDLYGQSSRLFLVLCGSYISFMEREILAEQAPLYGRRTGQQWLLPLNFREASPFFPNYDSKEKLLVYGILGGMPAYLSQFNPEATISQNIGEEMLRVQGYLYDEVNFLLRMELKEIKTYTSLLQAIAEGCTRLNEIAQRAGLEATAANRYLSVLRELHLVRREVAVTERAPKRSRKGRYRIADNYLKFWFRFILPNVSFIESGRSKLVYDRLIRPYLNDYMGPVFEEICREYI